MIQVKSSGAMYYALQAMAKAHQMTEIGLPEQEIVHALWIPDLSLDALTRKSLLAAALSHAKPLHDRLERYSHQASRHYR
jgi:hypothetical protein